MQNMYALSLKSKKGLKKGKTYRVINIESYWFIDGRRETHVVIEVEKKERKSVVKVPLAEVSLLPPSPV
jgi:transposase